MEEHRAIATSRETERDALSRAPPLLAAGWDELDWKHRLFFRAHDFALLYFSTGSFI
jgi:hypothetical protein